MKEINIVKVLTEKLKRQRDVSRKEADLIYMLERLHETYRCLSGFLGERGNFPIDHYDLSKNENVEFSFVDSFLNPMSRALKEWYETVGDLTAAGLTGNFVATIPVKTLLSKEKEEKDTVYAIKRAAEHLSEEDRITEAEGEFAEKVHSSADGFLALDFYRYGSSYRFTRYGLASRVEKKSGYVFFLKEMAKKLEREDITPEESDMIYIIMKFIQAMSMFAQPSRNRLLFEGSSSKRLQMQMKRHQKALSLWFEEVYKAASAGRSGNFLYTIPIYGLEGLDDSRRYISETLKLFPEQLILAKFPSKPDLPDMAGVFFDEKRKVMLSQRCNVAREIVRLERYANLLDPNGISCLVEGDGGDFTRICEWYEKKQVIKPFILKIEYLSRRKGIVPVCRFCNTDFIHFIAYDKKDEKIVQRILDMPEERLMLELPPFIREKGLAKLFEESFSVMDMLTMAEFEEDDSWVDIER